MEFMSRAGAASAGAPEEAVDSRLREEVEGVVIAEPGAGVSVAWEEREERLAEECSLRLRAPGGQKWGRE